MATVITSECINCGACEPECPNTAIYQGGVEWDLDGVKHPAVAQDIFFIVPEKCTECVGFYDHEACAAVCPVDCCIPDPEIPETEDVLLARAKVLHPEEQFIADFPSRFRKEGGAAASATGSEAAPAATATPAAAPASASTPAPAAPRPATTAPGTGRVNARCHRQRPRPLRRLPPRKEKAFPGELPLSYETALTRLDARRAGVSGLFKTAIFLAQPLLGALPYSQKKTLESAVSDTRVFTAAGATGVNVLHNMILYPAIITLIGSVTLKHSLFSQQLNGMITLGVALAVFEAVIRMREGIRALPPEDVVYRAAWYAPPLAALCMPFLRSLRRPDQENTIAVDGFHGAGFDDKIERERRYGEVYSLQERGNGYYLRLEFPRMVPKSALKDEMGVGDEMPNYDYELSLRNGFFVVRGMVTDPAVRKLAAVSPAFPPDFTTNVELPGPVTAFKHRFRGKTLEVVLLKK